MFLGVSYLVMWSDLERGVAKGQTLLHAPTILSIATKFAVFLGLKGRGSVSLKNLGPPY